VSKPAIGITISYDSKRRGFHSLREDYVRAVERAGALPLVLAPGRLEDAPGLLERLDGLLLSGGGDVDPELFGEARHEKVASVVRERDEFEIALARTALERDVPLLAICRGQQVLNVAAGGTLVQDIPSQVSGAVNHDPDTERWQTTHDVEITPGTRLHAILGKQRVAVNSFHHQSVRDVGRGLVVSARSPEDAVVEGLEAPDRRFAVAVQWHPEGFWNQRENFGSLFEALVEAAR
jgi:putative glutamine amidotransferase